MEESDIQADVESNRLCNILPSYSMYNSLYRGQVDSDDEPHYKEPPLYLREQSPTLVTPVVLPPLTRPGLPRLNITDLLASSVSARMRPDVVANENLDQWRETLLDNIHRLENLLETNNAAAKAVDIEVVFTRDLCEAGTKPIVIDPTQFEYNKGDFLNGYIIIENKLKSPIPFDMFYVVFEGTVRIKSPTASKVDNFLTMFDFSGSFNAAQINRLDTDKSNPFLFSNNVDSYDGTFLSFLEDRMIHPGKKYKRFFTFKIPQSLLDTKCPNDIGDHLQLPPTFGGSVVGTALNQVRPPISRQLSQSLIISTLARDFAIHTATINYGVLARFIGRKLKYGIKLENPLALEPRRLVNPLGDEYIILQELTGFVRVIQRSEAPLAQHFRIKQAILMQEFKNIVGRVQEVVKQFEEEDTLLQPMISAESKELQLYRSRKPTDKMPTHSEQVKILFKLLGFGKKRKPYGTLRMVAPQLFIRINYMPTPNNLLRLRNDDASLWQFNLELNFGFLQGSDSTKLPDFKEVAVLLMSQTYTTKSYPIPMEFASPNLTEVALRARKLAQELRLVKNNHNGFSVDTQLISDVWALCDMDIQTKELYLRPPLVRVVNGEPWTKNEQNGQGTEYVKTVSIPIDLAQLQLTPMASNLLPPKVPAYDRFCLVPSFQSCYVGRYYYLQVTATTGHDQLEVKIPVIINKPNSDHSWLEYKRYLHQTTRSSNDRKE